MTQLPDCIALKKTLQPPRLSCFLANSRMNVPQKSSRMNVPQKRQTVSADHEHVQTQFYCKMYCIIKTEKEKGDYGVDNGCTSKMCSGQAVGGKKRLPFAKNFLGLVFSLLV